MTITPNRGDSPCVCGYTHPCCRYLVDGKCPHRTPGSHHHSSDEYLRVLYGLAPGADIAAIKKHLPAELRKYA